MRRRYTVRPGRALKLDARVALIEPLGNEVTVSGRDIKSKDIASDERFEAEGAAGLTLTSTATARVDVTYSDEAP